MIRTGLTGYPLVHSLSPKLHNAAFATLGLMGEYQLFPIAPGEEESLDKLVRRVRTGELDGLNITIPHKQSVIPFLDELTTSAQSIGAVNTLYLKGGRLIGHNTDAPGFLADLAKFLTPAFPGKKALVLGAGGAARAVVYGLLTDGWKATLAVRRADVGQAEILIGSFERQDADRSLRQVLLEAADMRPQVSGTDLIVNATPIGMYPEIEFSPWPDGLPFPEGAMVYDLVYNPRETRLVREARTAGLKATTGLGMLVEQAALSFTCWTGREAPREVMFSAVEA